MGKIKITELRLGNLVKWKGSPAVVKMIFESRVIISYLEGPGGGTVSADRLEPLPISETKLNLVAGAFDVSWFVNMGEAGVSDTRSAGDFEYVKTVHQWQNLYFILNEREYDIKQIF